VPRRPEKGPEKEPDESDEMLGPLGNPLGSLIRGAPLEPIRFVERELTSPDGTKLRVNVPVYPPFRLEERPPPKAAGERPAPTASPERPAKKAAPEPRKRPAQQKKAS
jgi:hypothetical protein